MQRLLVLLCLLSIGVQGGCAGGSAEAEADGEPVVSIAIDVPPGAGIDESDVSFKILSPDDYDGEIGEAVAGFELLPDGAQFDEPVRITLTVVDPPDGTLSFIHGSSDGIDGLNVVSSEADPSTATITVVAELTHFSKVWATSSDQVFSALMNFPGQATVGVPFTVSTTVTNRLNPWPWNIHTTEYIGDGVTPARVRDVPPFTNVKTASYTAPQTFTCTKVGTATVWYTALMHYYKLESNYRAGITAPFPTYVTAMSRGIDCAEPTPTSTPTKGGFVSLGTATPTATPDPFQQIGDILLETPVPPTPTVVKLEPVVINVGAGTFIDTLEPRDGWMVVYVIDGEWYHSGGLHVAKPDACDYVHVHGGPITPVNPLPASLNFKTESLGACGFGPPNFLMVPIPR